MRNDQDTICFAYRFRILLNNKDIYIHLRIFVVPYYLSRVHRLHVHLQHSETNSANLQEMFRYFIYLFSKGYLFTR